MRYSWKEGHICVPSDVSTCLIGAVEFERAARCALRHARKCAEDGREFVLLRKIDADGTTRNETELVRGGSALVTQLIATCRKWCL